MTLAESSNILREIFIYIQKYTTRHAIIFRLNHVNINKFNVNSLSRNGFVLEKRILLVFKLCIG